MLVDIDNNKPLPREKRDESAQFMEEYVSALAMVSVKPMARMSAGIFFAAKPPTYPVKTFKTAKDAKEWLMSINLT